MYDILGKHYYLSLDNIQELCKTGQVIQDEQSGQNILEINFYKYEVIKMCIERILNEFEQPDDDVGVYGITETSISFRIAMNTLIKNNILIEEEDE